LSRSRSDFILDTVCREAESVLLDQRYFALSKDEFKRFAAMLDRPRSATPSCGCCRRELPGNDERSADRSARQAISEDAKRFYVGHWFHASPVNPITVSEAITALLARNATPG
jgi:hypothetical protein